LMIIIITNLIPEGRPCNGNWWYTSFNKEGELEEVYFKFAHSDNN